ncbi:hypothetical protein [Subtercola sp. RTI3]|uniref:hypothetical protein n=1 Tax=Subtercola sp. RTI3 TaxID=3048639 RepID=UPI002B23D24A|nr:hypothetical protein [Subtercola sp. RTI3]MEA9986086.1 hypothetical protein [Subtercola sp. RTI3]
MNETLSVDQMRVALESMSETVRAEWVEGLRKAGANLENAAYGLAGNVPDAKPDPITWSLNWLSVANLQVARSNELLTASLPEASKKF